MAFLSRQIHNRYTIHRVYREWRIYPRILTRSARVRFTRSSLFPLNPKVEFPPVAAVCSSRKDMYGLRRANCKFSFASRERATRAWMAFSPRLCPPFPLFPPRGNEPSVYWRYTGFFHPPRNDCLPLPRNSCESSLSVSLSLARGYR